MPVDQPEDQRAEIGVIGGTGLYQLLADAGEIDTRSVDAVR